MILVCATPGTGWARDVLYVAVGGRGIGICARTSLTPLPTSDLLDAVLGVENLDLPASGTVEGDCRPGALFTVSSTAFADPVGVPTTLLFDARPFGVVGGRSEFAIPGSSFLASVAQSQTDYVVWILPFDPHALGSQEVPVYDWTQASSGSGLANINGSVVTAYTDDTEPTANGSITSRVLPSISSAIRMVQIVLPLHLAIYPRFERCALLPGNPNGCVDPFASGYAGELLDSSEFSDPLGGFNTVSTAAGQAPFHTVRQSAEILGVFPLPLDLVSVSATSRVPNPNSGMGGFASTVRLNDPDDTRAPAIRDPFGTGELAGVGAGAFLKGDLDADLDQDLEPDTNEIHAQFIAELGFRPFSMLRDPPVPSPLPTEAAPDSDRDGFNDGVDNCTSLANESQADTDRDGIGDACDNCRTVPNGPSLPAGHRTTGGQVDDDLDGFGNRCDADFNGNGFVNVTDLLKFLSAFGKSIGDPDCPGDADESLGPCARYDLTVSDSVVNVSDLLLMLDTTRFGQSVTDLGCAAADDEVVHCPLACDAAPDAPACP